jgi:hypothetical protein
VFRLALTPCPSPNSGRGEFRPSTLTTRSTRLRQVVRFGISRAVRVMRSNTPLLIRFVRLVHDRNPETSLKKAVAMEANVFRLALTPCPSPNSGRGEFRPSTRLRPVVEANLSQVSSMRTRVVSPESRESGDVGPVRHVRPLHPRNHHSSKPVTYWDFDDLTTEIRACLFVCWAPYRVV